MIGLQLYTVRDVIGQKNTYENTLMTLGRRFGYEAVELCGAPNLPLTARELKTRLNDAGLKVVGSHVALSELQNENKRGKILEFHDFIGCKYLVDPYTPTEDFVSSQEMLEQGVADKDKVDRKAKQLQEMGRILKGQGFDFGYHNHAQELLIVDDTFVLEYMMAHTDPELVNYEIDIAWVDRGGDDPVAFVKKALGDYSAKRFPIIHIKDYSYVKKEWIEAGLGDVDVIGVLGVVAQHLEGIDLVVEQDEHWVKNDPMLSAQTSLNNLNTLLFKLGQ